MALRNLRSDLAVGDLATPEAAGLTFGKGTAYDRANQEFSREPFIKEGLDFKLSDSTINSVTEGFIRGGAVYSTERRIEDGRRIGRFFITSRGITFLAKQVGLQKSNPKISEPVSNRSNANQRTYNTGVNTLTQIGLQGTGTHLKREGSNPFNNRGYIDDDSFLANYKENDNTNRLLYLYDNHILLPQSKEGPKTVFGRALKSVVSFFKGPGEPLYSYYGGPNSTYGIGVTNINKYSPTKGFQLQTGVISGPKPLTSEESVSDENAANAILNITNYGSGPDYPRFFSPNSIVFNRPPAKDLEDLNTQDKNLDDNGGNYEYNNKFNEHVTSPSLGNKDNNYTYGGLSGLGVKNYLRTLGRTGTDYFKRTSDGVRTFHRESRIGLGNPGGNPTLSDTTVDLINALDVFKSSGDLNVAAVRDLIRFRMEAVNPENPTETNVMVFRAFLDSLDDSFNANYNEFNYNGRGESFYTYNSFNRSVSFSFKVAAQSSREMKPLYRKLNYLLSNTAPEYNINSGRMMTPFMKVTIGSYLDRLPGVITNVNITWDTNYPFEIAIDAPEGGSSAGMFVLPHVLNVSVSYQPIHDFLPQKDIKSPFIIPSSNSGISNNDLRRSWTTDGIADNIEDVINRRNNQSSRLIPVEEDTDREIPTVSSPTDDLGAPLDLPNAGNQSTFNYSL